MQWDCWVCVRASECPLRTGLVNPRVFVALHFEQNVTPRRIRYHHCCGNHFLKVLFRKVGLLCASGLGSK